MQTSYSYENFKDYLLDRQSSVRVKEDALWVNHIPLPLTMLDEIFSLGEELFTLYAETLLSAFILAQYDAGETKDGELIFGKLPDPTFAEKNREFLSKIFKSITEQNSFRDFEKGLFHALGTTTKNLSEERFFCALIHKGKKYNRLYYPKSVSKFIDTHFAHIKQKLKKGNGDMFGNIVADSLKVYRNGFSDAFSLIFNRFLDYKIEEHSSTSPEIIPFGDLSLSKFEDETVAVEYGNTNNGVLWEPKLSSEGKIYSLINTKHQIFSGNESKTEISLFQSLIYALSDTEMAAQSDREIRQIENFRESVSRFLRNL